MSVSFYLKSYQTFKEKAENLSGSRVFECVRVKDGANVRLTQDDPEIVAHPAEYGKFKAAIVAAGEEKVFAEVRERGEWHPPIEPRKPEVVERELEEKQAEVLALENELKAAEPEALPEASEEKPKAKTEEQKAEE